MMLNKAVAYGYRNAGFIRNRGYFSRENIRYMDKCGYDFVIMVKGMKSLCNDAIRQVQGTFEDKRQCSIRRYQVSGTTLKMPRGRRKVTTTSLDDKSEQQKKVLEKSVEVNKFTTLGLVE